VAQDYGEAFAAVYNRHWAWFGEHVAPRLRDHYEMVRSAVKPPADACILDLACGTGQLALHFLEAGYDVTGIDLSLPMLRHAVSNCDRFVRARRARFVQAEMTSFGLAAEFGLVTSTYDALNHLAHLAALRTCFAQVAAVLAPGGMFIFDLNTAVGLRRWGNVSVQDEEELFLLTRGLYDEVTARAWTQITGFARSDRGCYRRFEEVVFNSAFALDDVGEMARDVGFKELSWASVDALHLPLDDPEAEGRVFGVARA
jgi:SAM-dependent methyltransferase